jgi:hypothetical protein
MAIQETQEEILAKEKELSFNSIDVSYIAGKGKCYAVHLPFSCSNFNWILNREAIIDGVRHTVVGVEVRSKNRMHRAGELVSFLVKDFGKL